MRSLVQYIYIYIYIYFNSKGSNRLVNIVVHCYNGMLCKRDIYPNIYIKKRYIFLFVTIIHQQKNTLFFHAHLSV